MIQRPSAGNQRPPHPQRIPSGGSHRALNRPALPSKLSNVNLASQNDLVDLTDDDGERTGPEGQHPQLQQKQLVKSEIIDLDGDEPGAAERNFQDGPTKELDNAADGSLEEDQLPFPQQPRYITAPGRQRSRNATLLSRGRRDPARRAYGLEPPAIANKITPRKIADFFPWTGIHPEDVLNEQVIKSGYCDKPPGPTQSESNFARPTLWPVLKNKQGLQVLSALFVQVLDKRQNSGRCTAPSTFRPPPRVALTDTKREAWLRDLAKSDVPLRRLSRTIPHGVKGKVLLDQCIDKNIPIPRAIWLAKCVGANEIRGFKRKGVSDSVALTGELKWVREWTVSVEQFFDSIVASCGQPNWQTRINYAIRLATNFFSEQLLDTEHYMDWLLTSLESTSPERLPIWLVLVQIYWKHLVSQRKRGRRLAEILLSHLHTLTTSAFQHTTIQIILRIQQLVTVLAVSHRGCLILPRTWDKHKHVLAAIDNRGRRGLSEALNSLERRNRRLAGSNLSQGALFRGTKLRFIDLLDSVGVDVHIENIAAQAQSLVQDPQVLVDTLLEWASSKYRNGHARIYLAARLLRHWKSVGMDVDEAILHTLARTTGRHDIDRRSLHRVIAELVRSKHFSVGRYLQWLISMGAFSGTHNTGDDAHLILNIPTAGLTPNVANLRATLLQRLGFSLDFEKQQITSAKEALSSLLSDNDAPATRNLEAATAQFSQLTGAVKLAVGQWLCEEVCRLASYDINLTGNGDVCFALPEPLFCRTRSVLEQLEDHASLSVLLSKATTSTDASVLTSIVDTVNMHAQTLAAIGALPELTSHLCKRQRLLRVQQPLDKVFLGALSSLMQRVPTDPALVRALNSDVALCEQQISAAACSPASDSMIAQQPGTLEADEDISRVLSSGNSMDDHLMQRMFSVITQRAAKAGSNNVGNTARWYSQLRTFDQSAFDQLAQDLMRKLATGGADSGTVTAVSCALVGMGSMQLDVLHGAFSRQIETIGSSDPMKASRLAATSLQVLVPSSNSAGVLQSAEAYRFSLEKELFCTKHSTEILSLLRSLSASLPETTSFGKVARSLCGGALVPLLRRYIVHEASVVAEKLGVAGSTSPSSTARMDELLTALLNVEDANNPQPGPSPLPTSPMDLNNQSGLGGKVSNLIASATEISLPLCQLALQHTVNQNNGNQPGARSEEQFGILQSLKKFIEEDRAIWPQLLNAMGQPTIQEVCHWAQSYILDAASAFIAAPHESPILDKSAIYRYLKVLQISSSSMPADTMQGLTTVIEKLRMVESVVDNMQPLGIARLIHKGNSGITEACFWISTLLQLVTLYQPCSDSSTTPSEHTSLVYTLCSLCLQPNLQMQRQTIEHTLDVALVFSDGLCAEAHTSLSRHFNPSPHNNACLSFILGTSSNPFNWLSLASRVQPPTSSLPPALASAPTSVPASNRSNPNLPPRPGAPNGTMLAGRQQQQHAQQLGTSNTQARQQPVSPAAARAAAGPWGPEIKFTPFNLRRWEIMPDPTPNMGENDASLSLTLFAARRV